MIIVIAAMLMLCSGVPCYAQGRSEGADLMQKRMRDTENARRHAEEIRLKRIEILKSSNPALYEHELARFRNEQKIEETLSSYRAGRITEPQARAALRPVARARAKDEYKALPDKIKRLKKALASSEQELRDPLILPRHIEDRWIQNASPPKS